MVMHRIRSRSLATALSLALFGCSEREVVSPVPTSPAQTLESSLSIAAEALPLRGLDINDAGQILGTRNGQTGIWTDGVFEVIETPPGFTHVVAQAINNLGQVGGTARALSSDDNRVFIWSDGILTLSDIAGGVVDLNDEGQVAGNHYSRPFLWDGSSVDMLPVTGGDYNVATAINNSGVVVGWLRSPYYGLRWSEDGVEMLIEDASADDINDAGEILAKFSLDARAPLLYRDGVSTVLPTLDCCLTRATALNDQDQIVGWASIDDPTYGNQIGSHALLWMDGQLSQLPPLGGRAYAYATAINNAGEIIGLSYDWAREDEFDPGYETNTAPTIWRVALAPAAPQEITEAIADDLHDAVTSGLIADETATPLLAKIEAVTRRIEEGRHKSAANLLRAFTNQVAAAVKVGRMPADLGASFIEAAERAATDLAT